MIVVSTMPDVLFRNTTAMLIDSSRRLLRSSVQPACSSFQKPSLLLAADLTGSLVLIKLKVMNARLKATAVSSRASCIFGSINSRPLNTGPAMLIKVVTKL
ncbi:hypothetical protein D3C76_1655020 [compost metagenome]